MAQIQRQIDGVIGWMTGNGWTVGEIWMGLVVVGMVGMVYTAYRMSRAIGR